MHKLIRHALAATLAAVALAAGGPAAAQASDPAAAPPADARFAPPADFQAPPLPKPDETNGQRRHTQPGNNAPFWRDVRGANGQRGSTTLPGVEEGVLIQSLVRYPGSDFTTAGEAWRQVRNNWIVPYGGALLLVVVVALALFYFTRGPVGSEMSGRRTIERFTYFERAAHWCNAIAFCILAISGIVIAFGRLFALPVLGGTLFGWITWALKTLHNFAGPVFAVTLLVVLFTFVRDNVMTRIDFVWLKRAGGMLGGDPVPSPRFNAGEKLVFWGGVLVLGLTMVGSGFVLNKLVPGMDYTRGQMQVAHMVHAIAAMLMMAVFLGHIYMGTLGMRGAYRAMRDGYVDEHWAAEHHALWLEDIKAGRVPAQRSRPAAPVPPPAGTVAAK